MNLICYKLIFLLSLQKDLTEKCRGFGRKPFFVGVKIEKFMEFRVKVEHLIQDFLQTREDLYLVDLKISVGNDVVVILDGDKSLSLQDCLEASRAIEFNLDREDVDFSLQVMSPGLSEPLLLPRQYRKNIGRDLEVVLENNEKIVGELVNANEEKIELMLRYRRPKLIGKGKEDVEEKREIPYAEIKKALVVIKF